MTHTELIEKYPPSQGCSCPICQHYCTRPGWWSVHQARQALRLGYANRMMMEVSPELTFAVLSPAFRGNEGQIAIQQFANNSCGFLHAGLCELHDSEILPLECAFCHHDRVGQGLQCHAALEADWNTLRGQSLVMRWCDKLGYTYGLELARYFYGKQNRK